VQHLPEPVVPGQPGVGQGLVETGDRPGVHVLVDAVAAVHPDHEGFVTVAVRIGRRPAEGLRPVGGEPLGVLGMETVTEGVAHHLVRHNPGVPRVSQPEHAAVAARGLIYRLHIAMMACSRRNDR